MKHLKKRLIGAIAVGAALIAPSVAQAQDEAALVVIETGGAKREYVLADLNRISFGSTALTFEENNGTSTTYAYSLIDRIDLNAIAGGVDNVIAEGEIGIWPTRTTGAVNVQGAAPGTRILVYSQSGAVVASAVAAEGITTVDLSAAPTGICVLTVGKQSVKIVKL